MLTFPFVHDAALPPAPPVAAMAPEKTGPTASIARNEVACTGGVRKKPMYSIASSLPLRLARYRSTCCLYLSLASQRYTLLAMHKSV